MVVEEIAISSLSATQLILTNSPPPSIELFPVDFTNPLSLSLSFSVQIPTQRAVFLYYVSGVFAIHPHLPSLSPFCCCFFSGSCSDSIGQMGGETKVFTLAEVSEHNTPKDCWLVIEGKVGALKNRIFAPISIRFRNCNVWAFSSWSLVFDPLLL